MKVLFITYYWPPAGGVSVQRILHFVKGLHQLGVECHVIHPSKASYYQTDPDLNTLVPQGVHLHPVRIKDITAAVKKLPGELSDTGNIKSKGSFFSRFTKYIRANYFIPDPKVSWVKPVTNKALSIIKELDIDLVFTNGTPHSVHLSGLNIKKATNLPWIADFRDPWTKMDNMQHLPLSPKSWKKHQLLEKEVIKNADLTLTVSPSWANDFKKMGAKNSACITNGFDTNIKRQLNNEGIIAHVGSLHADRSLDLFVTAYKTFLEKSDQKSQLVLVGSVAPKAIAQLKATLPSKNLNSASE